ncbi:lysozyme inhibitor LprI family protein [Brevundimonas viscosa]|uniref:Uncharacterized conserved protein YecT, DUF1311 family n=1 Tax=Brevundimonas viscosa TaxID=871741 RepID=A0A1I6Q373_9CAUL|nr:lysozyme inhibitor LprI family protein [Brevundimonas viscosa]SFS46897.1 Uncharacterized conserved protein YecT, DUF1311 family [Brevundimonas viscosa]
MKLAITILSAVLVASWASAAGAQDDAPNTPAYAACMEGAGGVTALVRECISEEHAQQDALLNEAYRELIGRLDSEARSDLRNAQRTWIAFRDAECAWRASGETGTMGPLIIDSCQLGLTTERAARLQTDLGRVSERAPSD